MLIGERRKIEIHTPSHTINNSDDDDDTNTLAQSCWTIFLFFLLSFCSAAKNTDHIYWICCYLSTQVLRADFPLCEFFFVVSYAKQIGSLETGGYSLSLSRSLSDIFQMLPQPKYFYLFNLLSSWSRRILLAQEENFDGQKNYFFISKKKVFNFMSVAS